MAVYREELFVVLWLWDDLLVCVNVKQLCNNRTFPALAGELLDQAEKV